MQQRVILLLVATTLYLTAVAVARAQDSPEIEELLDVPLAELMHMSVVSASKRPQQLFESPSAISIITREEILASPSHTIPELLQYVVGMDGYTKTHTDFDIAARGFAYDETPKMLVLINHQPVNVVPYSGVQWPTIPLSKESIERIEIVRGPSSATYGADALVGVINILTLKAGERKNTAALAYGNRGTQNYELHLARTLSENLSVAFTGGFTRTERKGDVETPEARLAAPNFDIKDWADIYLLSYRLDYQEENLSFFSEGGYTTDEEGYNPSPGDASVDLSKKRTAYLNGQLQLPAGPDEITVRAGFRNLWQNNQRWTGSGYEYKYEVQNTRGVDLDFQYTLRPLKTHNIIFGSNINLLRASRDIANDPPYLYDETDNLWSLYAQDQVSLLNDRILLTLSGRYDKWKTFDGEFTPRAGANFDLYNKQVNLRLMVGSSFRRPAFDENYYYVSWQGGWFKGSQIGETTEDGQPVPGTGLQPEKLTAYEAGLRVSPDETFYLDAEFFRNTVKNTVGYTVFYASDTELNLGFGNLGDKVITKGLELELKKDLPQNVNAFFNYTYQTAAITRPGGVKEPWPAVPKSKTSGGISFSNRLTADVRFRYVSKVTYQEVPSVPVDGYFTLDLAISKEFDGRARLKLSAINLLDDEHYEYPIYTQITRKALLNLYYYF